MARVKRSTTSRVSERAPSIMGAPSIRLPRTNWPRLVKPMRPIRSVRTLMKRDIAKGVTQPEFRDTLMRAGVGVRQRAVSIVRQKPLVPPRSGSNTRRIATPSATNSGGVRNPRTGKRVGRGRKS